MFRSPKLTLLAVLSLSLISRGPLSLLGSATAADTPIPLHVAVKTGLVEVEVQGRGAAAGDSIQVGVRRKGKGNVSISVEPGTVVQPQTGPVQSMVLAGVKYKQVKGGWQKVDVIELKDNEKQVYILEGYCRDIEKKTPSTKDTFAVAVPDGDDAKVLVRAKQLGATVRVTQSAIWIQRSKVSDEELRRQSQLSAEEISAARQLLLSVERPDAGRDVEIKVALDRIRQLAARNLGSKIKPGDLVELSSDNVEVKSRRGTNVLGKLKKGQTLEVLGLTSDAVVIRAEFDGEKQRGLVKLSDVKLVKSASRPLLNAVLNAAEGLQLEVFDKIDADSGE